MFTLQALIISALVLQQFENCDSTSQNKQSTKSDKFLHRKCCPSNKRMKLLKPSYDLSTHSVNYTCVSIHEKNFFSANISFSAETGLINCLGPKTILDNQLDIWFVIDKNGDINVGLDLWFWPAWLSVNKNNGYCVDEAYNTGDLKSKNIIINNKNLTTALLYCGDLENTGLYLAHRITFAIVYFISSFFTLLTLLIYWSLWDEQNTHGCLQFSFFLSVLFYSFCQGIQSIIKANGLYIVPSTGCFVLAVIVQYFFITLNTTGVVLAFDLIWCFWHLDRQSAKIKNWKRLYVYGFISWILPFIFVFLALLAYHYTDHPSEEAETGIFPFAHSRCSSPIYAMAFFIQIALIFTNILIFLATSVIICKHRWVSRGRQQGQTQKHFAKTLLIFLKLFCALGMTWITILVAFFWSRKNSLSLYWLFCRVLNLQMGVVFFFMFGWCHKNVKMLRRKHESINRICTYFEHCKYVTVGYIRRQGNSVKVNSSGTELQTLSSTQDTKVILCCPVDH